MALADDIRRIRDRVTTALVATHDHYTDTRWVWQRLSDDIAKGQIFSYINPVTNTATTQTELLARISNYSTERIAEVTLLSFVTIFEAFFTDFLRAWLRAYPRNLLSSEPVPVNVILESSDKAAMTDFLIDRAVVGVLYRKPADWFAYIEQRLKLGCPTADEIARLAEAKATRDVVMHNQGVVNEVYIAKSGAHARHPLGEFIDVPDPYLNDVWELLLKIVADLADAVVAKFP